MEVLRLLPGLVESIEVRRLPDKPSTFESTSDSDEESVEVPQKHLLTLVLQCDAPDAGSDVFFLDPLSSEITIARGDRRRLEGTTLTVPDKRISSRHALIARDGHRFRIRDLGSANGLRVNGVRVDEQLLEPGDVMQIGHTLFAYEHKRIEARVPFTAGTRTKLVTLSPSYAHRLTQLLRVAKTPIPVLLLGESGTGKEVLARLTHETSGRPGAFIAVNCGAIPENLVESHLFGHRKGAFSGAVRDEVGLVRAADGGTLFLDEIGDLPATSQAALLRMLQEGEVLPVGSTRPEKVQVRVIAATHRSLAEMQVAGTFRSDLYARLSGYVFAVPRLAERREDLGQLIGELLSKQMPPRAIRADAASQLLRYDWPLNVRELVQALGTAAALSADGVIRCEHLPRAIETCELPLRLGPPPPRDTRSLPPSQRVLTREDRELRDDLAMRLSAHDGNVSAVAREMGKARQQIQRWIRRFELKSSG